MGYQSYQDWFDMLKRSNENCPPSDLKLAVPKCRVLNDLVDECLVFDCSNCLQGDEAQGPVQVIDATKALEPSIKIISYQRSKIAFQEMRHRFEMCPSHHARGSHILARHNLALFP